MKQCKYLLAAAAMVSLTTDTEGFVVPSLPGPVRATSSESEIDGHRWSYTQRIRALHESLHATDVTGATGLERSTESSKPPFNVGRHALDHALLSELNDPEVARAVMCKERRDAEGASQLNTSERFHATDVSCAIRSEQCTKSSKPPFTVGRHALDRALLSELNDPKVAKSVMCQEWRDTEDAPQLKTVPQYTAKPVECAATLWSSLANLPVAFMAFEQSAHSCTLTFWQQFVYLE
mmetsp:Transcript_48643/g.95070  ORF Transcript_48643/g.95070 Transcript_48643/m.95070 type:complete len:236 (-) Transcript_48643:177-884(-)|eukprot:CAMPEP_0194313750 /NCGR_PEP_ID=MMETSP0171-20130528/10601_1 /TAXON_ID=218684 /ORGANISM="Corethron pennatum, Strain L29A3" /LENGTH=235 /DNA_ID=CAMNT_0039068851 /DNA_START=99 /DNA_END=806 /DNA_ORIENTATION=-